LWVNRLLLYNLLWYQYMLTLNETQFLPAWNGLFSSFRFWRIVLLFENHVTLAITRELDVWFLQCRYNLQTGPTRFSSLCFRFSSL